MKAIRNYIQYLRNNEKYIFFSSGNQFIKLTGKCFDRQCVEN